MNKADLILHPARLKILLALGEGVKSIHEISQALVEVPKSSIYRHMKLLIESGMVSVAETRAVKGAEERLYCLAQPPHIRAEEAEAFTQEEHVRYFAAYLATLLQGFAAYVHGSARIDMLADRAGYSETVLHASTEELDRFHQQLQAAAGEVGSSAENSRNRRRRRFVLITYPLDSKED